LKGGGGGVTHYEIKEQKNKNNLGLAPRHTWNWHQAKKKNLGIHT
jgi:hypothetical protein